MDEFLIEVAKLRLKPVAWQVLAWLIGKRNVEAWCRLEELERSDDALWRATKDLERRKWIEKMEGPGRVYRITQALRERIDGSTAAPAQAAPSFSAEAPPEKPETVPSVQPEQSSFSQAPVVKQKDEPPEKPEPVKPPVAGFLGRSRETQLEALALWRRAAVRMDLLQLVLHRLENQVFVHPDLQEALTTAERWAAKLPV